MTHTTVTTLAQAVNKLVATAFQACGLPTSGAVAVRTTRVELGDFQCNAAMSMAKALQRSPRTIALEVAFCLRGCSEFDWVEVAGPGFINMRLTSGLLAQWGERQLALPQAGIVPEPMQRVLLDFGGPNVAKPLHVGHLRSLVIGESLRRILSAQGHTTISDAHLGDWGLQMGMLLAEIRRRTPGMSHFLPAAATIAPRMAPGELGLDMYDLQLLYPQAAAACQADPARLQEARELTLALQQGHAGFTALWRALRTISLEALQVDFALLDVHFDLLLGESDVQRLIPNMIADLVARGVATESAGALVVEVAHEGDAQPVPPLLLAKSDGAALYATTDLATILDRTTTQQLDRIIYVVDQRQALHFEQVFRAAQRAGYGAGTELVHAGFGTVNGIDGKPYKTRQGGVVQLADLLQGAIEKASERLDLLRPAQYRTEQEPLLDSAGTDDATGNERHALARMVGLAAVKFADLASYRTSGYIFDPERMVLFEGRTGPYVQYACVRIGSILERAEQQGAAAGPLRVDAAAERELLLECARFPDAVQGAAARLAPNEIADYVFALAQAFSRFYTECPVLSAENDAVRGSRLTVCLLTRRVLAQGLFLLCIAIPEHM